MIRGLYIGEVSRLALLKRAKSGSLLSGSVPDVLNKENSIDGAVVSNFIRYNF